MRGRSLRVFGLPVALLVAIPWGAGSQPPALRLVEAARAQVGVTVVYDPSYRRLGYPGGDPPRERGVCTDVVVRAYRAAFGFDFQVALHEDMARSFDAYPKLWGRTAPDPNIDHRRVPNLFTFLRRHGTELPAGDDPETYAPGDLVTWRLPTGAPHIGIVSDRRAGGRPLVVHNIGAGAAEEDVLFAFERTGHFRFLPDSETAPDPPR